MKPPPPTASQPCSRAHAGLRSEIELTDVVLKIRHPERATRKLVPGDLADADLIREWVQIRRTIIRPMLTKMGGAASGGKGGQAQKTGGLLRSMVDLAMGKAQHVQDLKDQIIVGLKLLDAVLGVTAIVEQMTAQINSERLIVWSLLSQGITDELILTRVIDWTRYAGNPPPKSKSRFAELRAIREIIVRPQ